MNGGGVRKCKFLLILSSKNLLTKAGVGSKRNISMVPRKLFPIATFFPVAGCWPSLSKSLTTTDIINLSGRYTEDPLRGGMINSTFGQFIYDVFGRLTQLKGNIYLCSQIKMQLDIHKGLFTNYVSKTAKLC